LAKENGESVGSEHSCGGSYGDESNAIVLCAERYGCELRLIAHFGEKESCDGRHECAKVTRLL